MAPRASFRVRMVCLTSGNMDGDELTIFVTGNKVRKKQVARWNPIAINYDTIKI